MKEYKKKRQKKKLRSIEILGAEYKEEKKLEEKGSEDWIVAETMEQVSENMSKRLENWKNTTKNSNSRRIAL